MLFTKLERYLLHNQADPLVMNSKTFSSKTDLYDTDFKEEFEEHAVSSKYY